MSTKEDTKSANKKRSNSADMRTGRYLPDGSLNIAGRWKSPGPGKYLLPNCTGFKDHDLTLNRRPAYTIGNRWPDETKGSQSPGPIYLPKSNATKHGMINPPVATISSRPKEYSLWHPPGPGRYRPEEYKDKAPAFTIGTKHKHLEIPAHPVGPNQYTIPNTIGHHNMTSNIKNGPKYTISSRQKFMSITYGMDETPTHLYNPSIDFVKTKQPTWTIAGRNYMPEMDRNIPGPNAYASQKFKTHLRTPPAFTMGIRHSEFCSTGLPAHNKSYED